MLPPARDLIVPVVSSTGADLTGVTVSATSLVNGVTESAVAVVTAGQVVFPELIPGRWQITTSGAPTLSVPHRDQVATEERILFPGGASTVESLTLDRFGKIVGSVELGFAGGGAVPTGWPVFGDPDGTVTISASTTPTVTSGGFVAYVPTATDEDGKAWELGVQYPDFVSEITTATVSALATDENLSVELAPQVRDVVVTVTSSSGGASLAGVTVSATSEVLGSAVEVLGVTGSDGKVTLSVTPGKWEVTTSGAADLASPHVDRSDLTPFIILPGSVSDAVSVGLKKFRTLSGTVLSVTDVDTALRTTVSGATVTATSSAGTVTTTTDNNGEFTLTLDPDFDWSISVTKDQVSSGTRLLAEGPDDVTGFELEITTEGRSVTGTISGADGRKVRISYQANGYLAQQVTLAASAERDFELVNLNRASTWTITFDLYKADGTTIERSITRWVGPGNEDVVLNQDLAGAPAGNVRVRLTDLGQAFDVGIRLPNLHVQVTARDFDGVQCLGVVRTTSYNVAQTAGDNVAMDVILPMPTGQFCVKVTPYVGSPSNGGTVAGAYQDPVTISAVTPDSGSPVNAITVSAADQAVDATVLVTLRPRTRSVLFTNGTVTKVTSAAVTAVVGSSSVTYWPLEDRSDSVNEKDFANLRPGRWTAVTNGAQVDFAVPVGDPTTVLSVDLSSPVVSSAVASLAFVESTLTGQATMTLPALRVEMRDSSGARITADPGTAVTLSATDGALLSGTLTRTSVNGLATFDDLRIQEPGTFELSVTDGTLTATISVVVQPAAFSLAFLTQPANLEAGQVMNQIQVEIRDSDSSRLVSFNGEVALAVSSGATLSGTTTITAVNGVATFTNLSTTTAGSFTLEATSAGLASTTSASFTVSPAAASAVQSTFTYSVTVGSSPSTAALTVTIKDSFGNIRTTGGDQVHFQLTSKPGGATATLSASTVTSTQGVATAELEVSEAGSYSVQARLGSSSGPVIGTVTIVFPGDPDG